MSRLPHPRAGAVALFLGLLVAQPATLQARPEARSRIAVAEETIGYKVRPGDSLYALASRYLSNSADYRVAMRLNTVRDPLRLVPGTILRLPVRLLRYEVQEARIAAVRGPVRIEAPGISGAPSVGLTIGEGSIVETGVAGFVSLVLPNGSRASLPPESRLIIRNLRRYLLTNSPAYDLVIERGKVETQATPLGSGGGSFKVRTPRAVSAVRGTRFRVGLAGDASGTEVLEGVVAAGAGERLDKPVKAGFGLLASASGETAIEPLLAAPELRNGGRLQVEPIVTLETSAVPGAVAYRVQLSKDAGFVDVVAEQVSPGPVARFKDIGNGAWFVRTTAIARSGLEGLAGTALFRRVLTGLSAKADGDASLMRFRWETAGEGAKTFRFQLRAGSRDGETLVDEPGLVEPYLGLRDLAPGKYAWRVAVRQQSAEGVTENWLPFSSLTVPDLAR